MAKLRNLAEERKRHHVFGPLMLERTERFLEPLEFSITALRELVGETQLILIMNQYGKQMMEKNNAGPELLMINQV